MRASWTAEKPTVVGTVHHQHVVAGFQAEVLQAPVGRLGRHRQGGRPQRVEPRRDADPVVHDRAIRCAGTGGAGVVGRAHDEIADGDIGDALADGVHDPGHLQPDAARHRAREQPTAQRPIGRVQAARMHDDADSAGKRARHGDPIQAQDLDRLAILVEAHGPRRRI
jgi:hypothetical protein